MSPVKSFKEAGKHVHFSAALLAAGALAGAFWYLDRSHDKGPIGLHDSVAVGAILLFVLIVAFPDRLGALTGLARAIRGKDKPE